MAEVRGQRSEVRVKRVRKEIKRLRLDALLISNPSNIFYVSNFCGEDSHCLITDSASFLITDFRYEEEARKKAPLFQIRTKGGTLCEKTTALIKELRLKKIGLETDQITVNVFESLKKKLNKVKFMPVLHLVENMRLVKDREEIKAIKKAVSISKDVMKSVLKQIRESISEKNISAGIAYLSGKRGADSMAFETIVASGPNASMPHAKPTQRRFKKGDTVIIDFGVRVNGYSSDLTRTCFVSRINHYFKLIHSIVKAAQQEAIKKIRPGIKACDIDKAARNYISKKGFGNYFRHATGHSVGIDVHEPFSINPKNRSILKKGMVLTIEPGIYIPEKGGVRIEDMVLVTDSGCEILSR